MIFYERIILIRHFNEDFVYISTYNMIMKGRELDVFSLLFIR